MSASINGEEFSKAYSDMADAYKQLESLFRDRKLGVPVWASVTNTKDTFGFDKWGDRWTLLYQEEGGVVKPILECSATVRIRVAYSVHVLNLEMLKASKVRLAEIRTAVGILKHFCETESFKEQQ